MTVMVDSQQPPRQTQVYKAPEPLCDSANQASRRAHMIMLEYDNRDPDDDPQAGKWEPPFECGPDGDFLMNYRW